MNKNDYTIRLEEKMITGQLRTSSGSHSGMCIVRDAASTM